MKRTVVFILIIFIGQFSFAQMGAMQEQEIAKRLVIGAFEEIWSNLDSTMIKHYHTKDFLLLEHGELWNNDTIRNYQKRTLERTIQSKRKNKFDFIAVEKSGNSIWLAYHNYATWTIDGKVTGKAHWLESAVAIKTKDGWKLQMLHSTRIQEE